VKNHLKSHFLTTKDYLVSGEEFSLLYDHENEMLQTDPQPHKDNLRNYYNSTAYISHTDSHEGFVAILYQWVKKRALLKNYKVESLLHFESNDAKFSLEKLSPFVHQNNIFEISSAFEDAELHVERNGNPKIIFTDLSIKLTRLIHMKELV